MLISFAWFTCGAKVLWNGYCGCILLSTPLAFQKKKYILCLLYLKLFVTSKCKLEGTGIVEVCPFWHVLSCIFIVYLSVMSPFVIIVIFKFFFFQSLEVAIYLQLSTIIWRNSVLIILVTLPWFVCGIHDKSTHSSLSTNQNQCEESNFISYL